MAVDDNGRLRDDRVNARQAGNFILAPRDSVQFIDVSPKQLVSVAASLIPFLEHDDANRALMGSNMQRQAVPLLRARAPFVGTGMEYITARDSGAVVVARRAGTVDYVDSQRIVVRVHGDEDAGKEMGADIYNLTKFKRSNQNTCISQKPIVKVGQKVHKGQIMGDGPCTELGELALGRNVLVAFMPWRGYNFEDAILVSERMVKDDYYTSIHIEEFEIEARDTKLGPEEITRDIPNVSETFLRDLDDSGIIRIGASVKPGDILVGKVTPKGETQLTPEEKLLRAIFGEKAGDVRDASLICPPGIEGIIVGVKIFSRKGIEKDDRAKAIEADELEMMEKNLQDEVRILHDEVKKRVVIMLQGQTLRSDLYDDDGRERLLKKGTRADRRGAGGAAVHGDGPRQARRPTIARLENDLRDARGADRAPGRGDPPGLRGEEGEDPPRRRTAAGRDQAGQGLRRDEAQAVGRRQDGRPPRQQGRHRAHPPRGGHAVPAGRHAGRDRAEPARRSVPYERRPDPRDAPRLGGPRARALLRDARLRRRDRGGDQGAGSSRPACRAAGKTQLFDGMTGEAFEQDVTVGYIYMLKLSHLVDDKIHARSIGPYSLITQQPLGGKAQFGGQRFGEMEVWALEAYGAAHILQELLTAKSDDVTGRAKIYEAIVKGDASFTPGLPESFNVLIRELQSLCLDVELLKTKKKPQPPEEPEPSAEPVLQEV